MEQAAGNELCRDVLGVIANNLNYASLESFLQTNKACFGAFQDTQYMNIVKDPYLTDLVLHVNRMMVCENLVIIYVKVSEVDEFVIANFDYVNTKSDLLILKAVKWDDIPSIQRGFVFKQSLHGQPVMNAGGSRLLEVVINGLRMLASYENVEDVEVKMNIYERPLLKSMDEINSSIVPFSSFSTSRLDKPKLIQSTNEKYKFYNNLEENNALFMLITDLLSNNHQDLIDKLDTLAKIGGQSKFKKTDKRIMIGNKQHIVYKHGRKQYVRLKKQYVPLKQARKQHKVKQC